MVSPTFQVLVVCLLCLSYLICCHSSFPHHTPVMLVFFFLIFSALYLKIFLFTFIFPGLIFLDIFLQSRSLILQMSTCISSPGRNLTVCFMQSMSPWLISFVILSLMKVVKNNYFTALIIFSSCYWNVKHTETSQLYLLWFP